MKVFSAVLLATVAAGVVVAQDQSSSQSMTGASQSSSASSTPSNTQSAMNSNDSEDEDGQSAAPKATATCTLFSGDPENQAFGCPENAVTSTPPYNSESLQSYLIGAYTHGPEGEHYSEVAKDLAKSVTEYYPTLTEDYSQIYSQYLEAVSQSADNYVPPPSGAMSSFHIPAGITTFATVAAAMVAGGAFML